MVRVGMTVGELVAYLDADDRGFDSGLDRAERRLNRLDSVTTSTTGRIESTVSGAFARVADAIGNGMDPDAALADMSRLLDGVEKAMADVEKAAGEGGQRAGQAAGDGFVRGADGRLRDAKGRFVKEGSGLFDPLADGAVKAGSAIGKAFDSALSVIGDLGPAKVGLLAAAVAALPGVASVASAGIVAAVGGALLAVGIKAAAGADRVQKAWTDLGKELKSELADAAKPLEGSLVRAADVAERAFDRLKPALKRIFKDLVPDVDHFVEMAGQALGGLGPTLERLGDSFGDVLSSLGDRMPKIIGNISDALDTFGDILDEDPQMLANLITDATELLKVGAEVLSWADEIKVAFSAPLGPAGSQAGTDYFFRQLFGGTPEEIAAGMEQLPGVLDQMKVAAAAGATAISSVGNSGNDAAAGVRNFSDALEEMFSPAQAALDAEIRLKEAIKESAKAAKDKKATEVDRLRSVQDLTGAIALAAQAEHDQTGKTTEASRAFADQLPTLIDLAGKNDAARDAVTGLGNSLGVTVKKTDDGKVAIDKFGKAVVTLPNGKTVKVDAETAKALSGLSETKRKVDDVKDKKVKVDADTKQAVTEVGKVTSKLGTLKGDGQKAGADLGSGLVSGIKSMVGQAAEAARGLANSALQAAKNLLGIHSPSTAMAEVGRWTVKGLIQGLQSEEGRAVDTVKRMVDQIKTAFASTPDTKDHLLAFVSKGNDSLSALAQQREDLVKRLADAKEYAKQVAGSAQEWASITGLSEDELNSGDFSGALKSRAQSIKDFANDIQTLARRGLNKTTLKQIIDAGVEGGASIAEMLVGEPGSEIKAINKAQAQIDKMSKQLGKSGADALYDVGKRAGDGYLKGLQDSLAKLDKEMTKIVNALVKAIKRELKIKSPSQVMADIGADTVAGLAVGITDSTDQAVTAIQQVAANVATAAAGSLAGSMPTAASGGSVTAVSGKSAGSADLHFGGGGIDYKQAPPTGTVVNVNMPNATIREETDIQKFGNEVGWQVNAYA